MSVKNSLISIALITSSTMLLSACNQSASNDTTDASTGDSRTVVDSAVGSSKTSPTVSLSSDTVNAYNGETFSLDIVMSNFSTTEGGGVTLAYDASKLAVTNVAVDENVWTFINKNGQVNNAEGSVRDILFSSYQGVSDQAVIATVEFNVLDTGTSSIELTESALNQFAGNGQAITVVFDATTVVAN